MSDSVWLLSRDVEAVRPNIGDELLSAEFVTLRAAPGLLSCSEAT